MQNKHFPKRKQFKYEQKQEYKNKYTPSSCAFPLTKTEFYFYFQNFLVQKKFLINFLANQSCREKKWKKHKKDDEVRIMKNKYEYTLTTTENISPITDKTEFNFNNQHIMIDTTNAKKVKIRIETEENINEPEINEKEDANTEKNIQSEKPDKKIIATLQSIYELLAIYNGFFFEKIICKYNGTKQEMPLEKKAYYISSSKIKTFPETKIENIINEQTLKKYQNIKHIANTTTSHTFLLVNEIQKLFLLHSKEYEDIKTEEKINTYFNTISLCCSVTQDYFKVTERGEIKHILEYMKDENSDVTFYKYFKALFEEKNYALSDNDVIDIVSNLREQYASYILQNIYTEEIKKQYEGISIDNINLLLYTYLDVLVRVMLLQWFECDIDLHKVEWIVKNVYFFECKE